jgi:triosephosphate isomerase
MMNITRTARRFMSRRPIVGGNWKCNPVSAKALPDLVANIEACDTSKVDVYVCPSPLHVSLCTFKNGAKIAPQNMNFTGCGAYTGEMAADQMVDMGIEWVLIGHSERRGEFGLPTPAESNELLATKCAYALEKGLKVVFAIGEPLPIREKGVDAVLAECIKQLEGVKGLLDPAKVVIAYEPVWAIGTGVTASPDQAQETHKAIREWIAKECGASVAEGIRIQYGGSANAKNAPELSAMPDIDGFLVGGASLKPEFAEIVAAIAKTV